AALGLDLRLAGRLDVTREIDAHDGAASQLALGVDIAAALLNDAKYGREAKAGAPADLLGGEERLENLLPHLLAHSPAPISRPDQHVFPPRHLAGAAPA